MAGDRAPVAAVRARRAASPAATSTCPAPRCTTTSARGRSATAGSGVTMTYRLAPGHAWPSGAEDVAAAVRVGPRQHSRLRRRSRTGSWSSGHSAGCVHVASYLVGHGGGALDGVRGAGLLSGFYTIPDGDARSEIERPYYGDLPSAAVSTLGGLLEAEVPLLFAVAQSDPPFSHAQVAGLTAAWFARHGSVPAARLVRGAQPHLADRLDRRGRPRARRPARPLRRPRHRGRTSQNHHEFSERSRAVASTRPAHRGRWMTILPSCGRMP